MAKQGNLKLKNRLINFAILGTTLLIIFIVYAVTFSSYVKGLVNYEKVKNYQFTDFDYGPLSEAEVVQLGFTQFRRKCPSSSYIHFPEKKAEGITRIGVFGCSYVFGAEAPKGYDFPSRLQEKYHQAGREDIEVINFGKDAYGMYQSFYLWNVLAKRYELDITVFNLLDFHPSRDHTFVFSHTKYGPVHGRYAVEGHELIYLPVVGNSIPDAADTYFSIFSPSHYRKYDSQTPPFLKALLPKKRRLKRNPFYYHPEPKTEWEAIYTAILDSVANSSKRTIVICGEGKMKAFGATLPNPNLEILPARSYDLKKAHLSFYTAQNNHPTTLGYQLVAEELYAFINDSPQVPLPMIHYEVIPPTSQASALQKPLNKTQKAYLSLGDSPISDFFMGEPGNPRRKQKVNFKEKGIKGLLLLPKGEGLRFIPLKQALSDKTKLVASFEIEGEKTEVPLAEIHAPSAFWGQIDSISMRHSGPGWSMIVRQGPSGLTLIFSSEKDISKLSININGTPVLKGKKRVPKNAPGRQIFPLSPIQGPWIYLRGSREQTLDVHQIPVNGTIDVVLQYGEGEAEQFPFLHFQKIAD